MMKRNNTESANGAATYVAPGTKIVGNLSGKGAYIFCGEVDGECDIDGPVTIAEGSHWKGSVRATEIKLAGTVEGDVTAKQKVEIAGSARISGSLRGASIVVSEGAVIEGEVSITQAKDERPAPALNRLKVTPVES
jgi:cytoskeletal protein CcmA (bactofilin family)